jgi:hypothetical protein
MENLYILLAINFIAFFWLIPAILLIFWGGIIHTNFFIQAKIKAEGKNINFFKIERSRGVGLILTGAIMIFLSVIWFTIFSKMGI